MPTEQAGVPQHLGSRLGVLVGLFSLAAGWPHLAEGAEAADEVGPGHLPAVALQRAQCVAGLVGQAQYHGFDLRGLLHSRGQGGSRGRCVGQRPFDAPVLGVNAQQAQVGLVQMVAQVRHGSAFGAGVRPPAGRGAAG